ncbi:hypothetical protein P280DRAFT_525472 [Massarina eburnea CBS 473.64]|uniref:Uncharacterized protein n=1 Tax=Massarina eburnea CBS 473.64 TaxID=1395130 RepID=A0A6A6SJP3_9PLEO|nr:hypothetical protein P280DRAFT_525472 [Massarina eburnea CBS 473.64]
MSATDYNTVVAKGRSLISILASSNPPHPNTPSSSSDSPSPSLSPSLSSSSEPELEPTALQDSAFTQYTDLAKYGYIEEPSLEPFTMDPLRECLQGLGVDWRHDSEKDGKNEVVYHVHTKPCNIEGVVYPKTNAYFSQILNRDQGVLIAHTNHTPIFMGILQDPMVTTYPPLHHWSDVAFLQYLGPSNAPAPLKLNFIIRYSIQNMCTIDIIQQILSNRGIDKLPKWPGIDFAIESQEALAVMGTPNGSGSAWLLAQHRRWLGKKSVEKVTVFYAQGEGDLYRWPSLVFWLKDGEGG